MNSEDLKKEICKHKRIAGREVVDNQIERYCCDCKKIINYVPLKCSGVVY